MPTTKGSRFPDKSKSTTKGYSKGKRDPKSNSFKVKEEFRSCNDVKWYMQNPQVATDAASISFASVLGQNAPMRVIYKDSDNIVSETMKNFVVPGIMVLHYLPTVGLVTNESDNVNVASRLIYTFIRHVNSGSRNYEAPDYMTYLLGVANAHSYYAYLVRLYGLLNISSVTNRYVNKTLIESLGGDYDNLVSNMASFRYYINQFAVKLNSLAVPKDMYYFDRLSFLPLHVFTDGEGSKSQMYVFKPAGFYTWNGTEYETGSALIFHPFDDIMQLSDYISYGNMLIESLLSNEDVGIMSGDTLKAFGKEGIRQLGLIQPEYTTLPIKDDGILTQIHNATTIGYDMGTINDININGELDITQENGVIVSNPRFMAYNVIQDSFSDTLLLDSWMQDPTPEFVLEATRFMCVQRWSHLNTEYYKEIVTSGTEILLDIAVIRRSVDGTGYTSFSICNPNNIIESGYAQFDWAPIICDYDKAINVTCASDLQNYTIIDEHTLGKVHNAALQSLFNVYNLYVKQV